MSHFKRAIEIQPNFENAHYNLGMLFEKLREFQKAINCYERAIKIDPNYADAHNNLGLTFIRLREYQKAIGSFKKAIQLNPNHASAHSNLIANCSLPISRLNMPIPAPTSIAAFRIIDSASAVFPMLGLPATIIKSPF